MRFLTTILLSLFPLVSMVACGGNPGSGHGDTSDAEREDYLLPVRVAQPTRDEVEDYVETQANLESDVSVTVVAEAGGEIKRKLADVGDTIEAAGDGEEPVLLASMDDRDQALALKDAQIHLLEIKGRLRELDLERRRNTQLLEQATGALAEAQAMFDRTSSGIADGTISLEEHETATFALNRAKSALAVAQSAKDKSNVALELGDIAVQKAEVARDRAKLALERTLVRAPFAGTVTYCDVRVGQRVETGQLLYRIEDPSALVIYGDIPVRQAARIRPGNAVRIGSTATPRATTGKVLLVEPTVNSASGTVRIKLSVAPQAGFKPGLFVSLKIVVETRKQALVVPKRAVLHDDEQGAYLFVVRENKAARVLVETGFERENLIEIVSGITEDASVVVEGQDTLTADARVEIKE